MLPSNRFILDFASKALAAKEGRNFKKKKKSYSDTVPIFSILVVVMEQAQHIHSLTSLTLDLPPSCIAFHPASPELFVVGTYHLHKEEDQVDKQGDSSDNGGADVDGNDGQGVGDEDTKGQKRTGSLILMRLHEDDTIEILQTHPTPYAVLDLQWNPHAPMPAPQSPNPDLPETPDLAVAASTGLIQLFTLTPHPHAVLKPRSTHPLTHPSVLILSLAWHPDPHQPSKIAFTTSAGEIGQSHPLSPTPTPTPKLAPHDLEAWTLAFAASSQATTPTHLLSGGDDARLAASTLHPGFHPTTAGPSEPAAPAPSSIHWTDRKLHQAGVTAILPLPPPNPATLVVTGSYDESIRLLQLPAPGTAAGKRHVLAETGLGGGVWRLKVLGVEAGGALLVLASCMHAGARVVRLGRSDGGVGEGGDGVGYGGDWAFEVLARFEEHGSMNYGSDFQPRLGRDGDGGGWRVVSTSFYDRLLCLWRFEGGG
ncbi:hypothetical protein MBLNU230_g7144t1 [Neophaeotheca triangularis]